MSREHGKIKTSLWRSKKFRKLTNHDRPRLLYHYFHDCPHGNSVGCYPIGMGYMIEDLFWGKEQIAETIDELHAVELIDWNDDEQVVRIIGFIDHDPPTNFKHAAYMAKEAMSLPDCVQKLSVIQDLLRQHAVREMENKSRDIWERLSATRDRLSAAYEGQSPLPCPVPLPVPLPNQPPTEVITQPKAASKPKAYKRKLPEGFEPKRDVAARYWRERGREDLCSQVEDQVALFRAHHRKCGSSFEDWDAAWVTWYSQTPQRIRSPPMAQGSHRPTVKMLSVIPS